MSNAGGSRLAATNILYFTSFPHFFPHFWHFVIQRYALCVVCDLRVSVYFCYNENRDLTF